MSDQENSLLNNHNQAGLGLDIDQVDQMRDKDLALIIDDDDTNVGMLKLILRKAGFNVIGALNGREALMKASETAPDVILLDLHMPEMDGWEVIGKLRTMTNVPVLIVSANALEDSIVRAFDLGADDYVTKPFTAKEVVARVQAALRRAFPTEPVKVRVFPNAKLMVNLETRLVHLDERIIKLSPIEFHVLAALVNKTPKPVAYTEIAESVWGEDNPNIRKRLKWAIHLLRKKLELDPTDPKLIVTHMNYGYQLLT